MKYFESIITQCKKTGMRVPGDQVRSVRTSESTILVLCDGIGSGIYANIAAITCAERLCELFRVGMPFKDACSTVADSMHRAHTEKIPYAAFSAVKVLVDGNFTAYNFDAPCPILIKEGVASVMEPRYLAAGLEVIGEFFGMLDEGDRILLMSDGVTQAGLGNGYNFGIESEGIAKYINSIIANTKDNISLERNICDLTREISGGRHVDDTSLAMLLSREANRLSIATGPPQSKSGDVEFVRSFLDSPGKHVICGSTTTDIISRVMEKEVEYVNVDNVGAPPEYRIEGIDMVTEGAMMLNQVYNILNEPNESLSPESPVERLCLLMRNADVVTFFHGRAINEAHTDIIFKKVGVRSRQTIINLIADRLEEMGKLVIIKNF